MMGIINKIFGNTNEKELKKLTKIVEKINNYEQTYKKMTDSELREQTDKFKERLTDGETLEDILPEAFAVVREASVRTLNMRPFDVQLLGGIVLHQGRIAEMKTGEGKTLVATMPVYLNALTGKGVHVVTVNDYLARRDSEWMGKVYNFLGIDVGLIVHGLDFEQRKTAYNADVTYGTNNEFGFDYLRDNMVLHKEHMVQRPLNYAIVDEVDSILIDEARTPLIISGQAEESTDIYHKFAKFVPKLKRDEDYTVDEKAHSVMPTEKGIKKAETFLNIENLYDEENMELLHHLQQALKAHALMKRDRDYVVKDDQVIIVDEFTGRLMFGRRYSDGLHQAIEAKEGVKIEHESKTLATITFQNYFRMYNKLAGMTGTAATEEEEFRKIYGLDVVVVPTNKPMIRQDYPDAVYKTERGKFNAVIEEIVECHRQGQPVLVGTVSIEKSEILSGMLKKKGVQHEVLNAKYHEKEAEIVARAGHEGAVTIATNMAGRGTDIVLGEGVADLGGLHIIGTERHESRRIDNQLRGRSGRQGDPGSSRFYVSLEDDLMRLFGSDNIRGIMDRLGMEEDQPIEHHLVTKAIENAQKKVEARNFNIRKHVLEYDDVMNTQREVIYSQRRKVLEKEDLKENIKQMIIEVVESLLDIYAGKEIHPEEWDLKGLSDYLSDIFPFKGQVIPSEYSSMTRDEVRQSIIQCALDAYEEKETELGSETMRELERYIMLKVVDRKWMDHIDSMAQLREGIGLRAYGQRDPVIEYKMEGYEMFQEMWQL
jgi:preprotein translocase subunit SecA